MAQKSDIPTTLTRTLFRTLPRLPRPIAYRTQPSLDFNFVLNKNGPDYVLESEEVPEFISTVRTSLRRDSIILNEKEMTDLPHDMIMSIFKMNQGKDTKFQEHFGFFDDSANILSPDLLYEENGFHMVMEIGTTRANIMKKYDEKWLKYIDIIRSRATHYKYSVLIVSNSSVCSTFTLSDDLCRVLCSTYLYATNIQEKARELGFVPTYENPNISQRQREVESMLEYFNPIFSDDILSCKPADFEQKNDYLKLLLKRSKELAPEIEEGITPDVSRKHFIGTSERRKRIVQFPYCVLLKANHTDFGFPQVFDYDDPEKYAYQQLWSSCFENLEWEIDEIAPDKFVGIEEEFISFTKFKKTRPQTHIDDLKTKNRFNVVLDDKHAILEFAKRGYHKKKIEKFEDLIQEEGGTDSGFSLNVDCSDIDRFLDRDVFRYCGQNPIVDRLRTAQSYYDQIESRSSPLFMQYLNTEIGHASSFISSTFVEININSRKSTKSKEWLLTYNRVYGNPILIHNTGSNKHIFFCVLFRKEQIETNLDLPFQELIDIGQDYYCTPLLSTRLGDIPPMINCISTGFSVLSNFQDTNQDNLTMDFQRIQQKKEFLFSFLLMLENKEQTSSSLMDVRYMYMDLMSYINPNPLKVMRRFPKIPRSRLLVLAINNCIKFFWMMKKKRFTPTTTWADIDSDDDGEEEETENQMFSDKSSDEFPDLLSFISGTPLRTFESALNLCYLGVMHEKTKGVRIHGYMKIFEKVMSEEIRLREARPEMMTIEGESLEDKIPAQDYKSHEFSKSHVRNLGKIIQKIVKGQGYTQNNLRQHVLNRLSKVTFESLSTLKASAEYKDLSSSIDYKDYRPSPRIKCLTAVLRILDEFNVRTSSPFALMSKLFEWVKEHGAIIVNLFKKEQTTGTREIFVLNMITRIIINFLETVSRSICDIMPNEYLTKGEKKQEHVEEHFRQVKANTTAEKKSFTCSNSADATTWCQRFIMPVFGVMFQQVFDFWPKMSETLCSILDLVTGKMLEIPIDLLKLFEEHQDVYTAEGKALDELKRQFLGLSEFSDLVSEKKPLMKNRSNFMQGILHYTSSLLHSAHLFWYRDLCNRLFDFYIRSKDDRSRFICTTACSSDDAGVQQTVIVHRDFEKSFVIAMFIFFRQIYIDSYALFTAKVSLEKSTLLCMNLVYEFNSEWFIGNTQLTPRIKWTYAAACLRAESSALRRMRTDATLISDLFSNGSSVLHCSNVEFACHFNHLITCGILSHRETFWTYLFNNMLYTKHPICWFYPLSHRMFSSTLGHAFTMYYHCVLFYNFRRAEMVSRKTFMLDESDSQHSSYSVTLPVGTLEKYFNFLNENNITREEIVDHYEKNPFELFTTNAEIQDERMKIRLKSVMSGVQVGFMSNNSSIATIPSVYMSKTPCFTVLQNERKYKTNLITIISRIEDSVAQEPDDFPVFLHSEFFEEMLSFASQKMTERSHSGNRRLKKMKLGLRVDQITSQCTLMDVIRRTWFSEDVYRSRFMITMSYKIYQKNFPWLQETFEESFKSFKKVFGHADILTFYEHIKNVAESELSIRVMTRAPFRKGLMDQLKLIYRTESSKRYFLVPIREIIEDVPMLFSGKQLPDNGDLHKISNSLAVLRSFSRKDINMINVVRSIFSLVPGFEIRQITYDYLSKINKSYYDLVLLMSVFDKEPVFARGEYAQELITRISMINQGTLVWFVQEQKKIDGKYTGRGIVAGIINNVSIRLFLDDDKCTLIETNDVNRLKLLTYELSQLFRKMMISSSLERSEDAFVYSGGRGKFLTDTYGTNIRKSKFLKERDSLSLSTVVNEYGDVVLYSKLGDKQIDVVKHYSRYRASESEDLQLDLPESSVPDRALKHWMNNKEASMKLCSDFYYSDPDWFQRSFYSRLDVLRKLPKDKKYFTGLSEEAPETAPQPSFDVSDMFDLDKLEEFYADLKNEEEIVVNMRDDLQFDKISYEDFELDEATFIGFTELREKNKEVKDYVYHTVFFDKLIRRLEEMSHNLSNWKEIPLIFEDIQFVRDLFSGLNLPMQDPEKDKAKFFDD